MTTIHISILLFENCMASEAMGIADMCHVANKIAMLKAPVRKGAPRRQLFSVKLCGMRGKKVETANGMRLDVHQVARIDGDLLLVPGLDFDSPRNLVERLERLTPEVEAIRSAAQRDMLIAAVCTGTFLLAEAGVLNGRRATTNWLLNGVLAARYPAIELDLNAMVTEDRGVLCSGAMTAAYDLGLRLVERFAGAELAQLVAKVMLLEPNRRSQAPYVLTDLDAQGKDPIVVQIQKWLGRNFGEQFDMHDVAARFAVSPRTLLRRFRQATGDTPLAYLQRVRIEHAKAMLETTGLPFSRIVERAGYQDESAFRRLFKRHTKLTPIEYQKRFSVAVQR
jgi:transcriptional regulator GlxA family with amidase domain